MADDFNFDDWSTDGTDTSNNVPSADAPAPSVDTSTVPSDPINMYIPSLGQYFTQLAANTSPDNSSIFGSTDTGTVKDAATPPPSSDQSFMDKFRSFFGFSDDAKGKNEAAKVAGAGAIAVGSGLISGAGAAYKAAQDRKIAQQNADSQRALIGSQVALNAAKTHQNLTSLKVNPGGMINAPYAPAPITPVAQRT